MVAKDDIDGGACRDVTLRSFRYVDTGNASAAVECYTDDAVLDRYGDVLVGRDAILGLLTARESDVSRTTCHAVVNYSPITVLNGVSTEASYSLLVFEAETGSKSSHLVGVRVCFDRYINHEGRWLIEYRRQEYLGMTLQSPQTKEAI